MMTLFVCLSVCLLDYFYLSPVTHSLCEAYTYQKYQTNQRENLGQCCDHES